MNSFKYTAIVKKIRQAMPIYIRKKLPKEIIVIAISSKKSQDINWKFHRKAKPANVLSFRYGPAYGEILLCLQVIRGEVKDLGYSYNYLMTWYIVHGMLHLAGLHHEKSMAAAKKVEELEMLTLRRLKVR